MILTRNIFFKNFPKKIQNKKVKIELKSIIQDKNEILNSLTKDYKYSFSKKKIDLWKKKIFKHSINRNGRINSWNESYL